MDAMILARPVRRSEFAARIFLSSAILRSLPQPLCFRTIFLLWFLETRGKLDQFLQRRRYEKEFGPPRIFKFSRGRNVGSRRTHDAAPRRAGPSQDGPGQSEFRTREAFGMEQRLLGSVIWNNDILGDLGRLGLSVEMLFNERHQRIFAAMLALRKQGKSIDDVTLLEELSTTYTDRENTEGLAGYASGLARELPDHKLRDKAIQAADVVKREWALRQLASFCNSTLTAIDRPGVNASGLMRGATRFIQSIECELDRGKSVEVSPLALPDLPHSALDGRLGEIVERRLSHFPRAYAWPSILTIAGALVPPMPDVNTNLYCALVGEVGSGKSQAIKQSIRVMGLTAPALEDVMAGSAEGLLAKLENANGAPRVVSVDEMAHLLSKAQIDRASFPFVLNRAFDSREFLLTVAHGKKITVNVSLSVIGGIVEDNFQQCFGSATTGGLHDRFVFGRCPRPFEFSYGPLEGGAEATDPCEVEIAPDVWDAIDSWLKEIPGLSGRHKTNALRAAVIAAAFSGNGVLRARDLGPAREFAAYEARLGFVLRPNAGENPDARCAEAIRSSLRGEGELLSRRELMRKVHAERFGPSVFQRSLNALISGGEVEPIGDRFRLGPHGDR